MVELDGVASFERAREAGCALGLHADHADLGVVQLGKGRDAAGQAATAHGNQDGVDQRQLLDDLHGDGALTGSDGLVVERRNIGEAFALGKFDGVRLRLVEYVAKKHDLGAVALGALDLDERRGGGHYDHGACTRVRGGVCHALCVVAGACGDDAAVQLLLAELGDLVVGAAQLVGTRALHVLGLEPYAIAALYGKRGALHQFGFLGDLLNLLGSLLKFFEG